MADPLGIGGDSKKRKDRGYADHLENPLGQRQEEHQCQLLSPVRTGEEKNAPDQIGNVPEEPRQGAVEQDQDLTFVGNGRKRSIKVRIAVWLLRPVRHATQDNKRTRRIPQITPVITLGVSGFDDVVASGIH